MQTVTTVARNVGVPEAQRYDGAWLRTYNKALGKITEAPDILPENKKALLDFLRYLDAKQSAPRTKLRYVYTYEKVLRCMPSTKIPILKATRKQLEECVININKLPIGEATKTKTRICLKVIYKYHNGDHGLFVPREVAFIPTREGASKERLTYSDLLTEDEISSLLDNTLNDRDSFLIALMADAPLRTHEILRLLRKHLSVSSNPAYLQIPEATKTGTRRIPLVNSVPHAVRYLEANKDIGPNDPLFLHEVWNKDKRPLTYAGLRSMLHKVAIRAGIDPARVFPYAFRHRWLSVMSSKISNATLENVAGWVPGTNMHKTYQHMNPNQDDIEVRRAYGIQPPKESETVQLRVKTIDCKVCKNTNPGNARYCSVCGRALGQVIALQEENITEKMANYMEGSDNFDKWFEDNMHRYLLKKAKGQRK